LSWKHIFWLGYFSTADVSNAFELMNEHTWFPGGLVLGNRFLTDGRYQNEVANDSCPA